MYILLYNALLRFPSIRMHRRALSTLVLSLTLVIPAIVYAANSDVDLRVCLQIATNNREQGTLDRTWWYHNDWRNLLEERRARYYDSWGVEFDRDRQNIQRDIDKDINNRLRALDTSYRNDLRAIQNDFKNAQKGCTADFNARVKAVPTGAVCFSTNDCNAPIGYCTVDTGECRASCQPGSNPCVQICSGRCKVR
jgi:hypothetical protein